MLMDRRRHPNARAARRGDGIRLVHGLSFASVLGDGLFVDGDMSPSVSLSSYGVKVIRATDSTGRELAFKSFQFFLSKDQPFEIEFSSPSANAESLYLELLFVSPSGAQRIRKRLPIGRNASPSYRREPDVWSRDVWEAGQLRGGKLK